jgi:hypothetical protein
VLLLAAPSLDDIFDFVFGKYFWEICENNFKFFYEKEK